MPILILTEVSVTWDQNFGVKNIRREPGFRDTDHRRRRGGEEKLELIQFREEAMSIEVKDFETGRGEHELFIEEVGVGGQVLVLDFKAGSQAAEGLCNSL